MFKWILSLLTALCGGSTTVTAVESVVAEPPVAATDNDYYFYIEDSEGREKAVAVKAPSQMVAISLVLFVVMRSVDPETYTLYTIDEDSYNRF